jgi:hypothetical protein
MQKIMKNVLRAIGNVLLFILTPFGIEPFGQQKNVSGRKHFLISGLLLVSFILLFIVTIKLMQ